MSFKIRIFLLKSRKEKGGRLDIAARYKILTPKQMFWSLPVAPEQVQASSTSENLLSKICQIIYSLY